MRPPVNFNEQYTRAKKAVQKAIKNRESIILYGSGCNGKTHLVNELSQQFIANNYNKVFYCKSVALEYEPMNDNPTLVESTDIDCVNHSHYFTQNENSGVVFINMNYCKYPTYSKTRSGRV